jgi:hypothetical protein
MLPTVNEDRQDVPVDESGHKFDGTAVIEFCSVPPTINYDADRSDQSPHPFDTDTTLQLLPFVGNRIRNNGECNELFYGVVFGRSVRMSFCSIHVARLKSINDTYHSPYRIQHTATTPTKETSDGTFGRKQNYDDDDDDSDDESTATDDCPENVALIRIQFTTENPIELRSYCRRFVKNGDLVSVEIPTGRNNHSGSTTVMWQESPKLGVSDYNNTDSSSSTIPTIWHAPRLVVNVNSVAQASSMVRVEKRNFWSMRQYQEWQRTYITSATPTIAIKSIPCTTDDKNDNNNSVSTTRIGQTISASINGVRDSHHGGGLGKRVQGEFVANFLLHMIASKVGIENLIDPSHWAQKDLQPMISPQDFLRVLGVLNTGSGVYDVAGGSGHVSMALGIRGVSSTVIDPREKAGKLPKRDRKLFQKSLKRKLSVAIDPLIPTESIKMSNDSSVDGIIAPTLYCQPIAVQFETLRAWFGVPPEGIDTSYRHPDQSSVSAIDDERITKCSAIVALHPDEATDAIVDTAVRLRIPFLIVPCCVFNRLFPHRRMPNRSDVPVSSHQDLLEYLQHRDSSIQTATLPFEGSNTILWSHF